MALRFSAPLAEIELEPVTLSDVQTLAPKGWDNPAPAFYVSGTSALLFDARHGDDILAGLRELLGDQLPEMPVFTAEASGLTWTAYQIDVQGTSVVAAVTSKGGKVYSVLVQGTADDIQTLVEGVLLPILNNFTIN
ncbi:MAG: hypothetical protein SNJ58_06585 [Aggregatilineales bacterium]